MPRRLEARDAVEVYPTERGQVAISQESPVGEDALILLEVHDVPVIVQWLQEVAVDAAEIRNERLDAVANEQVEVKP